LILFYDANSFEQKLTIAKQRGKKPRTQPSTMNKMSMGAQHSKRMVMKYLDTTAIMESIRINHEDPTYAAQMTPRINQISRNLRGS
jgi:hypothetical protein